MRFHNWTMSSVPPVGNRNKYIRHRTTLIGQQTTGEAGAALILSLIILAFLSIIGGALLMSTTIDVAIGDNYRASTQTLYLAEAGIVDAREALRTSTSSPSQLLADAAGGDGVLSLSRDLPTLLGKTDDIAFINGRDRSTGKLLQDLWARPAGRYFVFLRNDAADGPGSLVDTNQTLTLLCFGIIGNSTRTIEATVLRLKLPSLPAALTFNGPSPVLQLPNSNVFGINGIDPGGGGRESAIGVTSFVDQTALLDAIPDGREVNYPGNLRPATPPADIGVVEDLIDLRLRSASATENIIETLLANATDVFNPAFGGEAVLGNVGSSSDPRMVVVNGDCTISSGAGFGTLVVRGNLTMRGAFHWNGAILVIGQGSMRWALDATGQVIGGVFIMRTRDDDRGLSNVLGTLRTSRGQPKAVFENGGANAIQLNGANNGLVNPKLPYRTIAYREY